MDVSSLIQLEPPFDVSDVACGAPLCVAGLPSLQIQIEITVLRYLESGI
jgi:hypothetical protein